MKNNFQEMLQSTKQNNTKAPYIKKSQKVLEEPCLKLQVNKSKCQHSKQSQKVPKFNSTLQQQIIDHQTVSCSSSDLNISCNSLANNFTCFQSKDLPLLYKMNNLEVNQSLEAILKNYNQKISEEIKCNDIIQKQMKALKNIMDINKIQLIHKDKTINDLKQNLHNLANTYSQRVMIIQQEFKKLKDYYQHSYDYTIKRVEDAEKKINHILMQVTKQNSNNFRQIANHIKETTLRIVERQILKNYKLMGDLSDHLAQSIDETYRLQNLIKQVQVQKTQIKDYRLKQQTLYEQINYFDKVIKGWAQSLNQCETSILSQIEPQLKTIKSQNYSESEKLIKESIYIPGEIQQKIQELNNNILSLKYKLEDETNGNIEIQKLKKQNKEYLQTIKELKDNIETLSISLNTNSLQNYQLSNFHSQQQFSKTTKNHYHFQPQKMSQISYLNNRLKEQNYELREQIKILIQQTQLKQDESHNKIDELQRLLKIIQNDVMGPESENRQLTKQSSILSFGTEQQSYFNNSKFQEDQDTNHCKSNYQCKQKIHLQIMKLKNQNESLMSRQTFLKQNYQNCIQKLEDKNNSLKDIIQTLQRQNSALSQERRKLLHQIFQVKKTLTLANIINKDSQYQIIDKINHKTEKGQRKIKTFNELTLQKNNKKDTRNKNQTNLIINRRLVQAEVNFELNPLSNLLDTIVQCGFHMPVECEIDETGYLKHRDLGTYLIDKNGNMYRLNEEQISSAKRNNLINIV